MLVVLWQTSKMIPLYPQHHLQFTVSHPHRQHAPMGTHASRSPLCTGIRHTSNRLTHWQSLYPSLLNQLSERYDVSVTCILFSANNSLSLFFFFLLLLITVSIIRFIQPPLVAFSFLGLSSHIYFRCLVCLCPLFIII